MGTFLPSFLLPHRTIVLTIRNSTRRKTPVESGGCFAFPPDISRYVTSLPFLSFSSPP